MGGPGSGYWLRRNKKGTVEGHHSLDMRELHREHKIKPEDWMTLQYEWCGEQMAQEIHFDWTGCFFS